MIWVALLPLAVGAWLLSITTVVVAVLCIVTRLYEYFRWSRTAEQRQRDFLTAACLGIAAVQGVAIAYAPLDHDSRQMNLQFEDVLP